MLTLRQHLIWRILPIFIIILIYQLLIIEAYMKNVRIEEIPFGLTERERREEDTKYMTAQRGIHATSKLERQRSFFHIFHVPHIICWFAAKGRWPFIPPFMKVHVDSVSKSFFSQNDSYIRQFCKKYVQIKECFRPIFDGDSQAVDKDAENVAKLLASQTCTPCNISDAVVYFDKKHIGSVSTNVIYDTIEFLEGFLPPPTKKTKKKNNVRSRVDEMEIP